MTYYMPNIVGVSMLPGHPPILEGKDADAFIKQDKTPLTAKQRENLEDCIRIYKRNPIISITSILHDTAVNLPAPETGITLKSIPVEYTKPFLTDARGNHLGTSPSPGTKKCKIVLMNLTGNISLVTTIISAIWLSIKGENLFIWMIYLI